MKGFLRNIFFNFLTLFLIAKLIGAISFKENYLVLFWSAFFLTLLNLLVKPLLNLLLMPINLLTLGAFRWVVNVLVLLLVVIFVTDFKIVGFSFPGASFVGFVIPAISLTFFWALILVSFLIEVISNFLNWVLGAK
ncbi:MAG TPA: phage holin family protein [Patescibacteria group bacterium]|nr:phage holin family protein [Patescibacteria group bacterium]